MHEKYVNELDQCYQDFIKKPLEKFNGEDTESVPDEFVYERKNRELKK
jgi:hypothetical protein